MLHVMKHILISTAVGGGLLCAAHLAEARNDAARAQETLVSTEKPREVEGMGITEKLGTQLDLDLMINNELGEAKPLKTYFHSGRPVIFSLVYYSCPGLCNFHLNGVFEALQKIDWMPGRDFDVVAMSFDPEENAELAKAKKESYLDIYKRPGAESGIHFVTGSAETIRKVTEQVGFQYKWNESAKEWAHASAAIIVSPTGKVTRYLHGIMFDPKDMRLAISEGGEGKVGTIIDQMIWYCFKYDPTKSKYTLYAFRLMQVGGGLMILVLAAFLIPHWRREKALMERRNFG